MTAGAGAGEGTASTAPPSPPRRLRYGIQLTAVHGTGVPPARQLAEHVELARAAQELGFDFLSVGQHYLTPELRYYQPVPYLAHLATVAERMRVLTGIVLLPLQNPVDLAEQMATLDVVTGGRAILGVGLGYSDHEFAAFGVERRTRVSRFEESLQVIRTLWRGEPAAHHGRHFHIDPLASSVLPLQRPSLPVWIAGQTERAVRRAARLGDAWYVPPFPTHAELVALQRAHAEERSAAGLPAAECVPVRRDLVLAGDEHQARAGAAARVEGRFRTYLRWGLGQDLAADGFDSTTAEALEDRFVLGTPDRCAEKVAALAAATGMTHLVVKPQWPGLPHREAMQQLELVGTRLAPLLA